MRGRQIRLALPQVLGAPPLPSPPLPSPPLPDKGAQDKLPASRSPLPVCGLPPRLQLLTGSSPQTPPQREQLAYPTPRPGAGAGGGGHPPFLPPLASASMRRSLHRQWGQKACVTPAAIRALPKSAALMLPRKEPCLDLALRSLRFRADGRKRPSLRQPARDSGRKWPPRSLGPGPSPPSPYPKAVELNGSSAHQPRTATVFSFGEGARGQGVPGWDPLFEADPLCDGSGRHRDSQAGLRQQLQRPPTPAPHDPAPTSGGKGSVLLLLMPLPPSAGGDGEISHPPSLGCLSPPRDS